MAQRLRRRNCPHCLEDRVLTPDEVRTLNLSVPEGKHVQVKRGSGCGECSGTVLGRTGSFEILALDDNVKHLIQEGADSPTIKREAARAGIRTLRQSALRKLAEGVTSVSEELRVTAL